MGIAYFLIWVPAPMAVGVGTCIKIYTLPVAGAGVGYGSPIPVGTGVGIPMSVPTLVDGGQQQWQQCRRNTCDDDAYCHCCHH